MLKVDRMNFPAGKIGPFSVLTLALALIGCGSSDSSPPKSASNVPAPVANVVPAVPAQASPAAATAHQTTPPQGMPNQAMPSQTIPNQPGSNPGMGNQQMQQMSQMQGNMSNPNNNSNTDMMKRQAMASSPNNPNMNNPNMNANPGANNQMPSKGQTSQTSGAGTSAPIDPRRKRAIAAAAAENSNTKNAQANANPQGGGRMAGGRGRRGQMNGSANPQGPGGSGEGGNRDKPKFQPGTMDEVLFNFFTAMADDDTAIASDYISPKASGILGKMRDGELAEEKIEELTELMTPITELHPSDDPPGGSKRVIRNGRNQSITFTFKKDKDIFKLTDLTFTKAKQQRQL